jgi:single-strand DNA-binding protein
MNTITVSGNVGRDPELKYSASGTAVVKFSVADTTGKDDNKKTVWHDVVVFKEQAENVAASVKKGSRVIVTGRLDKSDYTGKDGVKKQRVEIIADDVSISLRWAAHESDSNISNAKTLLHADVVEDEEPF